MQNILVTGGLGFIGSNLIELLLLKKYIVLNLDKVSLLIKFL
jgi:dTDP-glucose 4,6-dehydratase